MKANCKVCGSALVPSYGWRKLPAWKRSEYIALGVRPRAGGDLCERHYQSARRGTAGVRYSNAEIRRLFHMYDPGASYSDRHRVAVVAKEIKRTPATILRAAQVGGWALNEGAHAQPGSMVLYTDGLGKEAWLNPAPTMQQ